MKYKTLKLLKSPQSHVMQIKEKIETPNPNKETFNTQKHISVNNSLDIYYVNLGKIRL